MADGEAVDVPLKAKTSDVGVRTASAVVMLAVAGGALWLGGWWWTAFIAAIALGVLWEWALLASAFANTRVALVGWCFGGAIYVGGAALHLERIRETGIYDVAWLVLAVVAVDVGAYFAGRAIGGPKIAQAISPSKTWAGLGGGIVGATVVEFAALKQFSDSYVGSATEKSVFPMYLDELVIVALVLGPLIAIVAQAGDFFESWMKRRAGVKDSGGLIPGHGGLLDRVDGLIAVSFVLFLISIPALGGR